MTTHRRLSQMATPLISLGCLVDIVGYCITWSPLFANRCQVLSVKPSYYGLTLMMMPLHGGGRATMGTFPRVGTHFPNRTLNGSPVARREDTKYTRSEEHTSELQSQSNLVCRLLLEKKKK